MSQIGLSDECKKLELTIENLTTGKEKCEMDTSRSLEEIVDYLRGYLNELKDLNCKIIDISRKIFYNFFEKRIIAYVL